MKTCAGQEHCTRVFEDNMKTQSTEMKRQKTEKERGCGWRGTDRHCTAFLLLLLLLLIIILILLLLLLLLYDMDVSCHRPFLPGTSLEPAVIPTAQASSFTLQYFPYCV